MTNKEKIRRKTMWVSSIWPDFDGDVKDTILGLEKEGYEIVSCKRTRRMTMGVLGKNEVKIRYE